MTDTATQTTTQPPAPTRATGRPFNTSTPLGKLMAARGLRVRDVERGTDISYRRLSDYLARRIEIRADHLHTLSQFLNVDPSVLVTYQLAEHDPEGRHSGGIPEEAHPPSSADMPSAREFLAAMKEQS